MPQTPRQLRSNRQRPTQQRAISAPAPDITLNSCSCGQPKLATESVCPNCDYEQQLMTQESQDTYVQMFKVFNDPSTHQTFTGTRCHCGRRKPAYRLQCSACDERQAAQPYDLPTLVSIIERPNDAARTPCTRCRHLHNPKYVYCRRCSKAAGYLLHNDDINTSIPLNNCACGRPKHPAFAECTKCHLN